MSRTFSLKEDQSEKETLEKVEIEASTKVPNEVNIISLG